MKIFLNTGFNIKNLYKENKKTNFQKAPENTGLKFDTVNFSGKKLVSTKEIYFNQIDEILSKIERGVEKDIEGALNTVLLKLRGIRNIEANNLNAMADGVKSRIEKKYQGIKGTVTMEEEGPFNTRNIIKFENGVLDEYIEGYEKSKDGIITAERKISFWPNGNLLQYIKDYKENGEYAQFGLEAIFNPDRTLGLYREGHAQYNFNALKTKRRINYRDKGGRTVMFESGYSLTDSVLPKNGIQVKYLRGKPCYITIEGETRNFDN